VEFAATLTFGADLDRALGEVREPLLVVDQDGIRTLRPGWPTELTALPDERPKAFVPACPLEHLGDPSFRALHKTRLACMSGAMANGIGSVEIVEAMGRGGMLGVFGAAGLSIGQVERAIGRIQHSLGEEFPYGFNLIHSPSEPALESAIVDLYLRRGIRLVEASAFLDLTLPVFAIVSRAFMLTHAAKSRRPTGSSPRSRELRSPPSFWPRRRSGCSPRLSSKATLPPSKPLSRRAFQWRRPHGRGRLGRSHRQPAGHRLASHHAGLA